MRPGTNVYRVLEEGQAVMSHIVRRANVIGLPVIVLGELYYGFEYGNRKQQNLVKLDKFLPDDRIEALFITLETARIFGEIAAELARIGKPTQQDDVWIAALCKQYRYVLLTADKAFRNIVGLDVIDFNDMSVIG